MKKLQNNFTTPEQSKRLLELGVPVNSADCCLRRVLTDGGYSEIWIVDVFDFIGQIHDDYLPCWSAGRLMEIFDICCTKEQLANGGWCSYRRLHKNLTYIDHILFEFIINKARGYFDFSKLEE